MVWSTGGQPATYGPQVAWEVSVWGTWRTEVGTAVVANGEERRKQKCSLGREYRQQSIGANQAGEGIRVEGRDQG